MKKQPRWMKSVLAASTEPQVALPWTRGQRRRPAALKTTTTAKARAQAAH